MAGLVPAIHVFVILRGGGCFTSADMTAESQIDPQRSQSPEGEERQ
jgi:hypothetical protein